MEHIPNEVFDHIAVFLDTATLCTLSCTSKQWYTRVSCQQMLWRKRFAWDFPQHDDNERTWLRRHRQIWEAEAGTGSSSTTTGTSLASQGSLQLDWFAVYCSRQAVEYRWRHNQYAVHRPDCVVDSYSHGTRLQSITHIPERSSPGEVAVVTQWLLVKQQQVVWGLERLCWDGVDIEHLRVRGKYCSDEYLAIRTRCEQTHHFSLYVWHVSALHQPPDIVIAVSSWISDVDMRGNWIVGQHETIGGVGQYTIFAYDLVKKSHHCKASDDFYNLCILRAAENRVIVACAIQESLDIGDVVATHKLWQVCNNQEAPFERWTAGEVRMIKEKYSSIIKPQRVDASRLILRADYDSEPNAETLPSLVLLDAINDAAVVVLKEKWSRSVKIYLVESVVSRNLLAIREWRHKYAMLSLSDGAEIYRVHHDCWVYSGLYPPDSQWVRMPQDAAWQSPKSDASLAIPDYTGHVRQSGE
ncbi:hypothetical protein THASP1DRAFT_33022 [Thamnocephalis sphaerospora]|uniref:F-box domain-containing protein n=1 Tax=Thamnocephalis sphaerospora TaxID=78915 RepID=A0A4P9XHK0_9FUNG|nr:hypothetical protein THASP1DRAFT_33022 [Thamnocephalis sphaerospora]|eukprot:RKP05138.1 hypothetical protein THASP1DRAFT_33022 [Thamnocephalis sphaerospora]